MVKIGRLRYVLSNTVKEHLIASVKDWEGLHSAEALMEGKSLNGVWYARSKEYEAKRQAERRAARSGKPVEEVSRGAFITHYELRPAPLHCWANLPTAAIRKKVTDMVREIEADAARARDAIGTEPLEMERVRQQDPLSRSAKTKRSPKPLCHAASKPIRERMKHAYRGFVAMFREASFKVKLGKVADAIFPKGCFPPSLPFMRSGEGSDPLADAGGSLAFALLVATPA